VETAIIAGRDWFATILPAVRSFNRVIPIMDVTPRKLVIRMPRTTGLPRQFAEQGRQQEKRLAAKIRQ
jgi:hypothetical protein